MFNHSTIQTNFQGLVGVRPSDNPDITPLSGTTFLRTSDSGIYITDLPGIKYDLLQGILGEDYSDYETYLEDIYNQCVINMLTDFWNNKKSLFKAKDLLENRVLAQAKWCPDNKDDFDSYAYGFKITPYKSNNIKLQANKVSVQIDKAGTFNIYVYDTKKQAPIEVKSITTIANQAVSVDLTSLSTIYNQTEGYAGSELMVIIYGHYDDGHTSVQVPQGSKGYSVNFKNEAKYVGAEMVQFEPAAWNWNSTTGKYDLPDLTKIAYTCETRGINVRINVTCDYTNVMIDNRQLFAKLLQLAIAIRLLWEGVNSYEHNATTESMRENWRQLALKYEMELKGYTDENKAQVPGYFEKLDIDLSNIDCVCMPKTETGVIAMHQAY